MFSGLNCLPVIVGEAAVQMLTLNTSFQRKETSKLRKSRLVAIGRCTVGRETAVYLCYAGHRHHQNQRTGNQWFTIVLLSRQYFSGMVKTRDQARLHVDHNIDEGIDEKPEQKLQDMHIASTKSKSPLTLWIAVVEG